VPLHEEGDELTSILYRPLVFCHESDKLWHQLFGQKVLL